MRLRVSSGFTDKLYWRKIGGVYHCLKKCAEGGYISLCHKVESARSGGQACQRPPWLRCGTCDGKEMDRRGWDESGPTSKDWK